MSVTHHISAYLSGTGEAAVYWQRHDQCVALWRCDGTSVELVRYWELERLSGLKHHMWPFFSARHRTRLLEELLATEGLSLADIDSVWGLPDLGDSSGILALARDAGVSVHSLGHLFTTLLMDTRLFRDGTIVALAIDAGPDFALERRTPAYWYSGAVVRQGRVEIRPVESPGLLYTAAVMVLGQEPGTLMAATCVCSCKADLASLSDDRLHGKTFFGARDHGWATATRLVRDAFAEAQGLLKSGRLGNCGQDRIGPQEHVRTVLMQRVQELAEVIAVRNVAGLLHEFDIDPTTAHLGMSGGSALNCPTNTRLIREFGFQGLLCPPCANDGGQALGLGLAGLYACGTLPAANFVFPGPYRGREDIDLESALAEHADAVAGVTDYSDDVFVADVLAGPLAWVDGAAEVGPRALGHRSLLGDPRRAETKDALNRMKGRQWWRPVAPMVLEEEAGAWFAGARRSPYMLEVFEVLEERRRSIPAVVHLDGTARIQTVSVADDARLHRALSAFAISTGVPVLCNTSLNAKGEPIVQSASQALAFCRSAGVRVLHVAGKRVELQPGAPPGAPPGPRRADLFDGQEAARDQLWDALGSRGVTVEVMAMVARAPQLAALVRRDTDVAARVGAVAHRTLEQDPAWGAYLNHLRTDFGPGGSFRSAFAASGSVENDLMPVVADLMQRI